MLVLARVVYQKSYQIPTQHAARTAPPQTTNICTWQIANAQGLLTLCDLDVRCILDRRNTGTATRTRTRTTCRSEASLGLTKAVLSEQVVSKVGRAHTIESYRDYDTDVQRTRSVHEKLAGWITDPPRALQSMQPQTIWQRTASK